MSIMRDLYFGNLVPWERGRPQDPNYAPISKKFSEIDKHFKSNLSSEEYKQLEEMGNLQSQLNEIEGVQLFEYALCMGVLMMIDVFNFKEKRTAKSEEE